MLTEFIPQIFVALFLFCALKMNLAELFGIACVSQRFTVELFARQIECAITNNVVAMEVPGLKRDSENFPPENVLSEE